MLLIETYLKYSTGKGIGLFARNDIKAGSTYWIREENFDRVFDILDIKSLNKYAIEFIKKYGFQEINDNWYLCYDNDRYCNHDDFPNTTNHFDNNGLLISCTAKITIRANQEILCDYREICKTCYKGVNF